MPPASNEPENPDGHQIKEDELYCLTVAGVAQKYVETSDQYEYDLREVERLSTLTQVAQTQASLTAVNLRTIRRVLHQRTQG